MRIEEVLVQLKESMTILLVTNLVQQAQRLSGRTMFLMAGDVIEIGPTSELFSDHPKNPMTLDYVRGAFG
jgi:phosphate transport system ATP-binding protein